MDGARHPHIVSYHQSYFANGAMTILMEFMDGGSLWDVLQRVSTAALKAGPVCNGSRPYTTAGNMPRAAYL
jgi:serine/threonine protein kinase